MLTIISHIINLFAEEVHVSALDTWASFVAQHIYTHNHDLWKTEKTIAILDLARSFVAPHGSLDTAADIVAHWMPDSEDDDDGDDEDTDESDDENDVIYLDDLSRLRGV